MWLLRLILFDDVGIDFRFIATAADKLQLVMKRLNAIMNRRKANETTHGFMTRRRWVGTFTCRPLILVYTVVKLSLDR